MTPAELLALAQRLVDGCRDPVTGVWLSSGLPSMASIEDVEEAARYLRDCAEAEPVATVRVHDTGGNAGIAWSGVPTANAGVMRGGTPLYTHQQPPSAQADAIEALRMALDALSCTGDPDDPGHRCGHCDEYVDRNAVVRKRIRAFLAEASR